MTDQPKIIFEDTHLMVLSKPAGLLSQEAIGREPTLIQWLRNYWGRNYVGLIHRLDRNTSGIMVVAKRTKAAARLTAALQKGEIQRSYLGWVLRAVRESHRWEDWLLKNEKNNTVSVVSSKQASAQKGITYASPVQKATWKGTAVTLMEFQLETGRSHQIRVQSAHHRMPLLGDQKYGKFKPDSIEASFGRPALHAYKLKFPHPMTGVVHEYEAPLPQDFKQVKALTPE